MTSVKLAGGGDMLICGRQQIRHEFDQEYEPTLFCLDGNVNVWHIGPLGTYTHTHTHMPWWLNDTGPLSISLWKCLPFLSKCTNASPQRMGSAGMRFCFLFLLFVVCVFVWWSTDSHGYEPQTQSWERERGRWENVPLPACIDVISRPLHFTYYHH